MWRPGFCTKTTKMSCRTASGSWALLRLSVLFFVSTLWSHMETWLMHPNNKDKLQDNLG